EAQDPAKVCFPAADSDLAFTTVRFRPGTEYPHCIGKTVFLPDLPVARTGTTMDGKISPSSVSGRDSSLLNFSARGERPASSTYGRSSGDSSI
ncbi:MAG: hypothetical protein J5898_10930, partial [Lachnospiraceae bacterium]|nr:hypothetical protein [Lachnospiraceae bacterium]